MTEWVTRQYTVSLKLLPLIKIYECSLITISNGLELYPCFNMLGFKNGDSACCGSGPYRGVYSCGGMRGIKEYELCENASEYLFFDSNHPSEVAYQQLAKLMWEGSASVTGPHNLKSFFHVSKSS